MNKEKLLERIKEPDEKLLLSKALNRAIFCIKNYELSFTDFLNPVMAFELVDFVKGETDLNVSVFGGASGCERVMAAFAPEYIQIENNDFPIAAVKISYETKFSANLTHRDFLGAVLGTGIVREKVGDIVIKDGFCICFVSADIADFVCINLDKVSHTRVKCEKTRIEEDFTLFSDIKEITLIVASMRLDALVSAVFKISRSKASEIIKGGKVFVNWRCEENVSKAIAENSIITARGYGRIKVGCAEGKTKKDRIVIKVFKYV
jgi:RNA-binding protein YlmH